MRKAMRKFLKNYGSFGDNRCIKIGGDPKLLKSMKLNLEKKNNKDKRQKCLGIRKCRKNRRAQNSIVRGRK